MKEQKDDPRKKAVERLQSSVHQFQVEVIHKKRKMQQV